MSEKNETFNYTVGIFDVITREIRKKVKENTKNNSCFGIGVYTDYYCENTLMTKPMKPLDDRMAIAQSFEGVDFVFPVNTNNKMQMDLLAENAYREYLKTNIEEEKTKQYKVGFAIGSFDVFHAGHLENLMEAKKLCDKLVVVLKTDERIYVKKRKHPKQSTAERAEILNLLEIVDSVIYYDVDATRQNIISDICERYKGVEHKDIVAIFGSDLKEKEQKHIITDWNGINVVFTNRPAEKMQTVSSTNYQRICEENGGIEKLEQREDENLQQ